MLDWLVDMLGLPERFLSSSPGGGVIQDSASGASLCALLAARERCSQFATNARGVSGRMTAYTSTQAHSSIEKAMMVAGLGRENLRTIDVDEKFALRPERLEAAIAEDLRSGARPCLVVATVGTTSSGAVDPLPARLARSVAGTDCGCMSMRRVTARPPCVRNSAACSKVWNWPTATVSIPTSGCLSTSIVIASSSRIVPL